MDKHAEARQKRRSSSKTPKSSSNLGRFQFLVVALQENFCQRLEKIIETCNFKQKPIRNLIILNKNQF